ncbi:hypothetical protein DEU56DRAFT_913538 [Suillus clintonianus]|uniref:uncharacterized protein n=1 Tax=Suillus clintonianus TaxID=1904413 RepID=UPI001B86409B|nr:uncharacterized protein DEU56DRAFT_913538 [Suillus clintonianus]KAG2135173.1 hypothetical protein DEU56DRAFT_913538 [Suillus clintonianus]
MTPADRLEYLDLHGQTKHYFEIKLTAEFVFEKRPNMFCWYPTTKTTVLASEPIECQIEKTMLEKIHTDFSCSIAHQVCRRWFDWRPVELPPKLLQRLDALQREELESKRQTQDMGTSSYIFPNPLSSPAIPNASIHGFSIVDPRSSAISTQPDDDWRYSLSLYSSHSSRHFSSTSDRSSLHSLSDEDTDELSKTAELLAEGITIRTNRQLITQPLSARPLKTHRQHSVPLARPQTPTKTDRQGPAPSIAGQQTPRKSRTIRVQTPMSTCPSQPLPVVIAPPPSPPPFIIAPCSPRLKHTVSSRSALHTVVSPSAAPIIQSPLPSPPPFIIAPCSPHLKHMVSSPSSVARPPPSPPPFIIAPCSPRLKHTVSSPSSVARAVASPVKSNMHQLYHGIAPKVKGRKWATESDPDLNVNSRD